MLKENEILKIRPVRIARVNEPDVDAVEMVLRERKPDGSYDRAVAALGDIDLRRIESNVNYLRRTSRWASKVESEC